MKKLKKKNSFGFNIDYDLSLNKIIFKNFQLDRLHFIASIDNAVTHVNELGSSS